MATGRLSAVALNPANAAKARGVELGFSSYPETGLEGTSVAAAGGGRVSVVLGVWSFHVKDIVDDDLVALDPSLAELSASSIGATFGFAVTQGRLGFGMLATHRAQSIVGVESNASAVSAGLRLDARPVEIGVSLIDIPLGSPSRDIAPRRAAVAGLGLSVSPSTRMSGRVEVNAYAPGGRPADSFFGASAGVTVANFDVITGYSTTTGWGVGSGFSWRKWHVEAATSLVSRDRLDRRVAFSLTYR